MDEKNRVSSIDKYLSFKENRGAMKRTLYEYRSTLNLFFSYLERNKIQEPLNIGTAVIEKYIRELLSGKGTQSKLSTVTINLKMVVIKDFYSCLVKTGEIKNNPCRFVKALREEKRVLKDILKPEEVRKLFEKAPRETLVQKVCLMLLKLSYHFGLRLNEALNIKKENLWSNPDVLTVKEGKGGIERTVPFTTTIKKELRNYLNQVYYKHLENDKGHLFYSLRTGKPLSQVAIRKYLSQALKAAGIQKAITHHSFRHSIAKHLLTAGLDVRYVQRFLGHHNINSTTKYTRLQLSDLREAVRAFHPREIKSSKYIKQSKGKIHGYYVLKRVPEIFGEPGTYRRNAGQERKSA